MSDKSLEEYLKPAGEAKYVPPPVPKRAKKGKCPLQTGGYCSGKTCPWISKACPYRLIMSRYDIFKKAMARVEKERSA